MKKFRFPMLLLLLAAVSCKVQEDPLPPPSSTGFPPLDVRTVKNFVETSIKEDSKKPVTSMAKKEAGTNGSAQSLRKDLPNYDMDWDLAYINDRIKEFPIVMVPLKNNTVERSIYPDMNPNGYRMLAFQHNDKGEIYSQIFEIHPDKQYVEKQKMLHGVREMGNEYADYLKVLDKDTFSGYMFIWDTDGTFQRGYHLTSGIYDRTIKNEKQ